MKLKRIVLLVAALMLVLLALVTMAACGDETTDETPAPCAHEASSWTVTKTATCTEKGERVRKCDACEKELERAEIATAAHTEKVVTGTAATCETDGLTDGKTCTVCGSIVLAQEKIAATGHRASGWITDKVATQTEKGSRHKACLDCEKTLETDEIPMIPYEHICVGVEWVVTTEPTCQRKGERAFVCSCGNAVAKQQLGKTEHTEKPVLGYAATCTEAGLTDGVQCTVCGTFTTSQIPIEPKGHKFLNGSCTGCGIVEPFGVWIVYGDGTPVTDVIVKLKKNGEQVKMAPYQGVFLAFEGLEDANYTVELDLSSLSGSYTYDTAVLLTPEKPTATVRLFRALETPTESNYVSAPIDKEYYMYRVSAGSCMLPLTPNDYTFFTYTPTRAAIWTVTYESEADLTISYHGGEFFVQGVDVSKDNDEFSTFENGLAFSVYGSNLGSTYVFAVYSTGATSCILNIKNAGDPGTRLEDEPWTPYLEDESVVAAGLASRPTGIWQGIDITDPTLAAVYNEQDGYYHLGRADGPVIYIDLVSDTPYVSGLQTICINQRIGEYVYDTEGVLLEKRSFNELFGQYGISSNAEEVKKEPVRVPLTKKLAEAVQSFGNKQSWWREGSDANIFDQVLLGTYYNVGYAWLLYCGIYAAQ